jgi:hypothetical protein
MKTSKITKLTGIPADAFASADGCWTIDLTSGAGDNGFLDCARAGHPGVGAHGSTKQAVDNLLACLPAGILADDVGVKATAGVKKTANFCGHGNDGIIVTGTGQNVSDTLKYISWWNRNSWKADLQRLRGRAAIVRLWACHPGTGQDGLNLLDYICQETGAISMGPTGFLNCGGGQFSLEANSTWQVVTPGQPLPQPIAAPTPHFNLTFSDMKIATGKEYENIAVDDVAVVDVLTADGSRTIHTLTTTDSIDLVRVVGFDNPFTIDGVPAAIITARLRIHFATSAAKLVSATREFIVWNDRQLEDALYRGHFYHAQPGLKNLLRMMQ